MRHGFLEATLELLATGAALHGRTLVRCCHYAPSSPSFLTARLLQSGRSVLHCAAELGYEHIVNVLLQHPRVDVNAADSMVRSPL